MYVYIYTFFDVSFNINLPALESYHHFRSVLYISSVTVGVGDDRDGHNNRNVISRFRSAV